MRPCLTALCLISLLAISGTAPAEEVKPRVEQTVCLQCHTLAVMKAEYRGIPEAWRKSIHYQNAVSCQDCHGGDPKNAALAMSPQAGFVGVPKPKEVPKFCGKCHLGIMENYLDSGHGKALMATGRGPNCVLCHGSHNVQKATIDIINPKLCGVCHSYDRAKEIKAALLRTEGKINKIDRELKTLNAGLISTEEEDKVLFRTQAEYRTLFHTVDVHLVQSKTGEFTKSLTALDAQVHQGFGELRFRQNFSALIMLIFIGLALSIFLLSRKSR